MVDSSNNAGAVLLNEQPITINVSDGSATQPTNCRRTCKVLWPVMKTFWTVLKFVCTAFKTVFWIYEAVYVIMKLESIVCLTYEILKPKDWYYLWLVIRGPLLKSYERLFQGNCRCD